MMRMRRVKLSLALLSLVLFATLWYHFSPVDGARPPNIIFILTDDQDVQIGGLEPMTKAKKLIGDAGIHFTNAYTTSPLCCPSRSSILTGRYTHNDGAVNNSLSGNCSSPAWQATAEKGAFATALKAEGYRTFFAGKYLNQYGFPAAGGTKHVPPGWDDWHGLVGNSVYYNYTLSVNGVEEIHGDNYEKDYLTNIIAERAETFLRGVGAQKDQPFFMMLSTPACHAPFTPAPPHADAFSAVKAPRNGSFDVYGKDKHWLLRAAKHPLSNSTIEEIDSIYRNRWRTLLSVDDMVEQVIATLDKMALLNETYIVFASDNGYHLGQFSLPIDKRQMYEFDIKVPLLVRGPNIRPGQTRSEIILNIDYAPTFMDLAGVSKPPITVDGRSFKQLLGVTSSGNSVPAPPPAPWRSDFLVEHSGEVQETISGCPLLNRQNVSQCFPGCVCEDALNNTYGCIRTISDKLNLMYCEFADDENFVEVFDMSKDPAQLLNIKQTIDPQVLIFMNKRLLHLSICEGTDCQKAADRF